MKRLAILAAAVLICGCSAERKEAVDGRFRAEAARRIVLQDSLERYLNIAGNIRLDSAEITLDFDSCSGAPRRLEIKATRIKGEGVAGQTIVLKRHSEQCDSSVTIATRHEAHHSKPTATRLHYWLAALLCGTLLISWLRRR